MYHFKHFLSYHSTVLNTFALLCTNLRSLHLARLSSPDGHKYSLGVTVTRPARGSLPTPARRWVPSTITQKLDRQPRACCHCSISGTHCHQAPPAQLRVCHCRAAACVQTALLFEGHAQETCGAWACSADSAETGMGCSGMSIV